MMKCLVITVQTNFSIGTNKEYINLSNHYGNLLPTFSVSGEMTPINRKKITALNGAPGTRLLFSTIILTNKSSLNGF